MIRVYLTDRLENQRLRINTFLMLVHTSLKKYIKGAAVDGVIRKKV